MTDEPRCEYCGGPVSVCEVIPRGQRLVDGAALRTAGPRCDSRAETGSSSNWVTRARRGRGVLRDGAPRSVAA